MITTTRELKIGFGSLKTKWLVVFVKVINSAIGVKFEILGITMAWIKTWAVLR
jgi:hypothetical protein